MTETLINIALNKREIQGCAKCFLQEISKYDVSLHLYLVSGEASVSSADLPFTPDTDFQLAVCQSLPDNLHLLIASDATPDALVLTALTSGAKVINQQYNGEQTVDMATVVSDFLDGFIFNRNQDWYAKLFDEPVYVGSPANICLQLGASINPRAILLNQGLNGNGQQVKIGRGSHLGADALLNLGDSGFQVGNFCIISANFSAHAMRHTLSHVSSFAIGKGPFGFMGTTYDQISPISVGHDVWIGEGVTTLSGVHFADGCVVGAGSVVTKSCEPYGIYAGNPANLVRYRFESEKIEALRKIEWWNFSYKKLREIHSAFGRDITKLTIEELNELF